MSAFQEIVESIPTRFRPEKAAGVTAVFHFNITGEEGFPFTVIVNNRSCRLERGLSGTADCVIKSKAENYVKLELGLLNPQLALMTGKVKVSNISEMMRFAKWFRKFTSDEKIKQPLPRPRLQGPLAGLKILDFTRLLPGPLATMMLADMGAEVIKIEDPYAPDYIRNFMPFFGNESALYLSVNRSKKSLAVNFSSEAGRKIIEQLVQKTDVLIEQFRPGVMEKKGLGYEAMKALNPRLIYVSITGYGQTGPYAMQAGHDLNYIGYSGLLGITRDEAGRPVIPGGQVADVAGGAYMAMNALLAAIYARERTGLGQYVDVAMLDCVMPVAVLQAAQYFATGEDPDAHTLPLSGSIANYNVYECSDEKFVALGALEPKFWEQFCDLVRKPEWKNDILKTGREMEIFKGEVAAFFKTKTREEWLSMSEGRDVCLSPVLGMSELDENPQLKERQMILSEQTENSTFKSFGVPLKFSATPAAAGWKAPRLGEDTEAVLLAAGLSEMEIRKLMQEQVIF